MGGLKWPLAPAEVSTDGRSDSGAAVFLAAPRCLTEGVVSTVGVLTTARRLAFVGSSLAAAGTATREAFVSSTPFRVRFVFVSEDCMRIF